MNEQQALAYIHSRERFGSKLGLERMRELMRRLGDPQRELSFIHVAGTNGKGSTVTMLSRILTDAGYRTGRYISPYVFDFKERISVDDQVVPGEMLAQQTSRVASAVAEMERDGWDAVTEFEVVTAVGFLCFAVQKCDIVVLEVGLGGRFDATNIIDAPVLAVIAAISLDHTGILGDTVEKIAYEKCGILKEGSRAVVYPLQPEDAMRCIETCCKERGVPFVVPDLSRLSVISHNLSGSVFCFKEREYRTRLVGEYQIYNAITVLTCVDALREIGWDIPTECAAHGILSCHMDARFDTVSTCPKIVLDAGHNPQGIDELLRILDASVRDRLTVIFAAMRDKEYPYAVEQLAKRADAFYAAAPADNPRAAAPTQIVGIACRFCEKAYAASSVAEALDLAIRRQTGEMILVCGSFYIMEEVKKYLKNQAIL